MDVLANPTKNQKQGQHRRTRTRSPIRISIPPDPQTHLGGVLEIQKGAERSKRKRLGGGVGEERRELEAGKGGFKPITALPGVQMGFRLAPPGSPDRDFSGRNDFGAFHRAASWKLPTCQPARPPTRTPRSRMTRNDLDPPELRADRTSQFRKTGSGITTYRDSFSGLAYLVASFRLLNAPSSLVPSSPGPRPTTPSPGTPFFVLVLVPFVPWVAARSDPIFGLVGLAALALSAKKPELHHGCVGGGECGLIKNGAAGGRGDDKGPATGVVGIRHRQQHLPVTSSQTDERDGLVRPSPTRPQAASGTRQIWPPFWCNCKNCIPLRPSTVAPRPSSVECSGSSRIQTCWFPANPSSHAPVMSSSASPPAAATATATATATLTTTSTTPVAATATTGAAPALPTGAHCIPATETTSCSALTGYQIDLNILVTQLDPVWGWNFTNVNNVRFASVKIGGARAGGQNEEKLGDAGRKRQMARTPEPGDFDKTMLFTLAPGSAAAPFSTLGCPKWDGSGWRYTVSFICAYIVYKSTQCNNPPGGTLCPDVFNSFSSSGLAHLNNASLCPKEVPARIQTLQTLFSSVEAPSTTNCQTQSSDLKTCGFSIAPLADTYCADSATSSDPCCRFVRDPQSVVQLGSGPAASQSSSAPSTAPTTTAITPLVTQTIAPATEPTNATSVASIGASSSSSSSNTGLVIGAAVGGAILLAAVVFLVFSQIQRQRRRKKLWHAHNNRARNAAVDFPGASPVRSPAHYGTPVSPIQPSYLGQNQPSPLYPPNARGSPGNHYVGSQYGGESQYGGSNEGYTPYHPPTSPTFDHPASPYHPSQASPNRN
ncbi:hypothetical protein BDK51DRAFT_41328, partial [Blyttiomyces helicus]